MVKDSVLDEIRAERDRQDEKWGEQNHADCPASSNRAQELRSIGQYLESTARRQLSDGDVSWAAILAEEIGEALQARSIEELKAELIQVAAVAAAWVEALKRRR